MDLADLIAPGRVIAEMRSLDREGAIAELVDQLIGANAVGDLTRESILAAFHEREAERSTGIGNGVAIPHCFLRGLEEVVGVFGRSTTGIDFEAVDHVPVHFVILFIVPASQHALHLKTLAAIARRFSNPEIRDRLANAADEEDLLEVLGQPA